MNISKPLVRLTTSTSAVFVLASLTLHQAHAAGFQVSESSASGLGRAYAGEAVIAEDASIIARNPSGSMLFETMTASAAIHFVAADLEVEGKDGPNGPQTAKNITPLAVVPAGFLIMPLSDQLAFGFAMFSGYGVTVEYPKDYYAGSAAGKTSLVTVNLNPSIAYRINEQFSIGGGVSLIYGDAELYRHYGADATALYPAIKPSNKTIILEGDEITFGWNIGATFELDADNRFGAGYRAESTLNFKGDFTDKTGQVLPVPNTTIEGKLPVVLPATFEISGHHNLSQELSLQYSILWTDWSKFKELKATNSQCTYNGEAGVCLYKKEEFSDNLRYAIGSTYQLDDQWALRGGFAYDEQAGKATLSIPDTDRYWFSVGATYNLSENLSLDAALTYLHSKTISFVEDGDRFKSSGNVILTGFQVNYGF